ncbi:SAF domain-containing protein [Georgenia sp. MJ173]|uniref:SAF domain-containing protein n=1 Tax=Georgenia sunbinii TaxID=3117728 RepID=UPI002F26CFA3
MARTGTADVAATGSAPRTGRPPSRRASVRWRRRAWRHRHLLAIAAVVLAGGVVTTELRPPPPATDHVLVLARDLPAGALLAAADVELVEVPAALAPARALHDPTEVVGGRLAVGLPAGLPITGQLLAGAGLAAAAPAGHVVVPVRLADDAMAALLRPGDEVDLLTTTADAAGTTGGAEVVAPAALVMSLHGDAGGGLLATAPSAPLVLVAVPRERVGDVVGANAWAPLRVVVPPPDP